MSVECGVEFDISGLNVKTDVHPQCLMSIFMNNDRLQMRLAMNSQALLN